MCARLGFPPGAGPGATLPCVMSEPRSRGRGLTRLIAVFKLMKVLALLALGLGLADVLGRGADETLARWISASGVGSHHALARGLLYLEHLEPRQWVELCAASFFYAVLFSIEGLGLWFDRPWAERFTLFITVSFIPFELYEWLRHPRALKLAALGVNVAVALYLWGRLRRRKRTERPASTRGPRSAPPGWGPGWNRGEGRAGGV